MRPCQPRIKKSELASRYGKAKSLFLRGDEAGLEALMRKYGNPLTLYINGYLHDVHEAEDLMIEVFFLSVHKKATHPGRRS